MSRRPHGVVYALLALSLAVNLVGAGYLVGWGYSKKWGGERHRPPRTVESTINFVASRYPKSVGEAVRQKLEARREEIAVALDEMKAARRETRQAIREQPLDKNRIEAAFAASREKAANFQRLIQTAIVEALPDLPESERGTIDKDEPD
jgi:uncharacterized membrane protein